MPDAMPQHVTKGKLLRELDAFLNHPANGTANRTNLTNELNNLGQTVVVAADKAGFSFPAGTRNHLVRHWFGKADGGGEWWEESQAQLLRELSSTLKMSGLWPLSEKPLERKSQLIEGLWNLMQT